MVEAVAAEAAAAVALGTLPEWDLGDLYPGRDSPELARDLAALASAAAAFRAHYEGRLAALAGGDVGDAVAQYERLQEVSGRIMSYAELLRSGNVADPEIARFFQTSTSASTRSRPSCCSSRWRSTASTIPNSPPNWPIRHWRGIGRGCAMCAPSARTSSPTRWKSCCT